MTHDGAIDIHVHAGPSFFERKYDAIELAAAYADSPLGGFVLKSHFGNTHKAAVMAESRVEGVDVYRSTVLNSFVGGFNPTAVEHALATDARIVWFPTFSAANFDPGGINRTFPFTNQTLTATTPDGALRDEVREIIEQLADHDKHIALGNGHLSRAESFAILEAMEEMGISVPYLITHADFGFMGLSRADQRELADRGAVIEKCYLPVVHDDVTVPEVVADITDIGPENCVISTDHGQSDNDTPPNAYLSFVEDLRANGLDDDDIEQVTERTARRLLGVCA